MQPRFVGRLGVADAVTALNAALGFCAVVAATVDVGLAARVVLLAAIADAIDGLLARKWGGTAVGPHLDSLADVASFSVAPAVIVFAAVREVWGPLATLSLPQLAAVVGVPALFVAAGVVRLALYTAFDSGNAHTYGVQTTLAGTVLAAGWLAGAGAIALLATTAAFGYLMVTRVPYPDLKPAHALAMGAVQALAVLFPVFFHRLFPRVLLAFALLYLVLAPWVYPRDAASGEPNHSAEAE
ncbi:protein sorting system archaetidylserine synthase [Halospeciosus flavus]|uniref:Protein sorting system archaetidylserine synthase n=1 Tax=Halospeciosus flavus TaxID=3032283 RepID=A0ABD5Z3U7_9EURY|nr:protein sorting system archaetidylserine synthase [Halospeciosus flavus]